MQPSIAIGKYTLESLTTGMYSSPKDLYREYIQNSVDSIDQAISAGIIKKANGKITIAIYKESKRIELEDNGLGIPFEQAIKKLTDIGNSSKTYSVNRGFRGIGRLAGLSYCDTLTFSTSYLGESKKNILIFDCIKLKQILEPGQFNDYDLSKVLSEVITVKSSQESSGKHYFKVILEGVNDIDGILNSDEIKDYLSQVAPLPFNTNTFKWGKEINDKLRMKSIDIGEYNIFIRNENTEEQIYKVNTDKFLTDRIRKIIDNVTEVKVKEIFDENGNLRSIMWYSLSNFYGTILDESKKGIRLRKGNILVGDKDTLNFVFKEGRFNGWFQGEVYVLDPGIIPNARRDNFEKNAAYLSLINELSKIGDELSKIIRSASNSRNDKSSKALNDAEVLINKADKLLKDGFNSQSEKQKLTGELNKLKKEVESSELKDEFNINRKFDIFKQLNILTNNVKGATNFKILNVSQSLSIDQKKTLERVFEVITEKCEKDEADKIIEAIMKKF